MTVKDNKVKLPKLGWVRSKEHTAKLMEQLDSGASIKAATVSRHAGRWFVSFGVERAPKRITNQSQQVVGVDVGLKSFITVSDPTGKRVVQVESPKPLAKVMRRLRRRSRQLSRKQRGSENAKRRQLNSRGCTSESLMSETTSSTSSQLNLPRVRR
jgi:putative transposase